jgi:hypothetical protein
MVGRFPPLQEARGAIAARLATRNDESAERSKDPNEKMHRKASRKNPSTPTTAPPANPTLNMHPGNGSRRTSPTGEETQGPSPMDYIIEIVAEFLKEMVIVM